MFVARKLNSGDIGGDTAYVTLRRNPNTIYEALDLAALLSTALERMAGEKTSVTIRSSERVLGEITILPAPESNDNWTSAIFSQSFLARVRWELDKNYRLAMPGASVQQSISLCRLDALGGLGYDVRDFTDAFEVDRTAAQWTPYPGFWDHDAKRVVQIAQTSNAFLIARTKPIKGRKLKSVTAVWGKAGKVLLVSRLWPITHKVLATGFDTKVIGNTWWAFDDVNLSQKQRKALLLWMNSTLGLLFYYGRRVITRSAWMQMKKPAWQSMPVLNVRNLKQEQLEALAATYDLVSKETFRPLAQLDSDPTRIQIDKALCKTLSLPSLTPIRELLVREPGLAGRK